MKSFLILTFHSLLSLILATSGELGSFKEQMEQSVIKITEKMEQLFINRCWTNITQCQTKSYNYCEGTAQKECDITFPKPSQCLYDGTNLSPHSAVRFSPSTNTQKLTNQERQFICVSAELEKTFEEVDQKRNNRYTYSYVGSSFGSFRIHPSSREFDEETNSCPDYDPRYRPWYVSAISASKNIIILIDTSGSMYGDKLEIAKKASKTVINTLNNNDFIGVISFGNSGVSLMYDNIVRATSTVKENLLLQLDQLEVSGKTNYQGALVRGLEMLNHAKNDNFGTQCENSENIFLFLTDGEPTVGLSTFEDLKDTIDHFNTNINLFTYAFGSEADKDLLQQLSCEFNGIMFEIQNQSSETQLQEVMQKYYTYLAKGLSRESPVWTEPYDDAFGYGRMVTVAMPIYYRYQSYQIILGVAGIDILLSQLQSFGYSQQQIITILLSNEPCLQSTLTECQIESFRKYSCGSQNCTDLLNIPQCQRQTSLNIFKPPQNTETYICCGITIAAFAGILSGIILLIIIVVGILVYKYRKWKKKLFARRIKEILQKVHHKAKAEVEETNSQKNNSKLDVQLSAMRFPGVKRMQSKDRAQKIES